MDYFPVDLLVRIIRRLDDVTDILALSRTCRRWRQLLTRPDVWSKYLRAKRQLGPRRHSALPPGNFLRALGKRVVVTGCDDELPYEKEYRYDSDTGVEHSITEEEDSDDDDDNDDDVIQFDREAFELLHRQFERYAGDFFALTSEAAARREAQVIRPVDFHSVIYDQVVHKRFKQ